MAYIFISKKRVLKRLKVDWSLNDIVSVRIVVSDNSSPRPSIWESLKDLTFSKFPDFVENYWEPLLKPGTFKIMSSIIELSKVLQWVRFCSVKNVFDCVRLPTPARVNNNYSVCNCTHTSYSCKQRLFHWVRNQLIFWSSRHNQANFHLHFLSYFLQHIFNNKERFVNKLLEAPVKCYFEEKHKLYWFPVFFNRLPKHNYNAEMHCN